MLPCLRLHLLGSYGLWKKKRQILKRKHCTVNWFLHFTFRSRQDYKLTISFLEIAWKVFLLWMYYKKYKSCIQFSFQIQITPKGGSPPKSSSPKKFSPNTNKRSSAAMHRQRSFVQNENDKSSSSPGFHRRSKTQLEIRPRKRNTSSTSSDNSTPTILNPQAKEFVMKNEVFQ